MTWPPVSSEEARELRDAEAEASSAGHADQHAHATRCVDGWLGENADGHPYPCLVCRPHLRPRGHHA